MSKTWFITGCSKGFGRALTEELLVSTNAQVIATARNPKALKGLEELYGKRLLVLPLDVTKPHDIKIATEEALGRFNRIDVLVNNAGYGLVGTLEECNMQSIRALFETNVFGLMEVTKAILPTMRAQKSGHILNISSIAGLVAHPGGGIYNATKFAVEGLSESMALDLSSFNIKVTLIEPGPFRTDFASESSLQMAPIHPAYTGTVAHTVRQYLAEAHGRQAGDPMRAAKIMIEVTNMENPPLRLLLGSNAFERLAIKSEIQEKEFKKYESLGRSADYDSL